MMERKNGRGMFATELPFRSGLGFIQLPRPMTAADWAQLLALLEAMRPGLVEEPKAQADGEGA